MTGIGDDVEPICGVLNSFEMKFINDDDKFQSLALCYRNKCAELKLEYFASGFVKVIVKAPCIFSEEMKFLLLYRKQSMPLTSFYETMYYFTRTADIDVILGDFNINALSSNDNFTDLFVDFEQIVKSSTHISGSVRPCLYQEAQMQFH